MLKNPEILHSASHPTVFHELLTERRGHTPLTVMELRDEALLMVFAGTDTVSNTQALAATHVLDDTDVHQRLKDELLQAWPKLADRPSYSELENLPFLVRLGAWSVSEPADV